MDKIVYGMYIDWEKLVELGYMEIHEEVEGEDPIIQMQYVFCDENPYGTEGVTKSPLLKDPLQLFQLPYCFEDGGVNETQCVVGIQVESLTVSSASASELWDKLAPKNIKENGHGTSGLITVLYSCGHPDCPTDDNPGPHFLESVLKV